MKLTGVIDWSWWWITAPLWGAVLFWILIFMMYFITFGFALLMI